MSTRDGADADKGAARAAEPGDLTPGVSYPSFGEAVGAAMAVNVRLAAAYRETTPESEGA